MADDLAHGAPMRQSVAFARYESLVPLERFFTEAPASALWECRDHSPPDAVRDGIPPLICLPGLAGTCDVFWRVFLELVPRGVRAITVTIPPLWSVEEFVDAFTAFLDRRRIRTAHLLGTNLGSLLAAAYAAARPARVASLILASPFIDTSPFVESAPALVRAGRFALRAAPAVVLRRLALGAFVPPVGRACEAATEFMIEEVDKLTGAALASRFYLNCTPYVAVDDPAVTPEMLSLTAAAFEGPTLRTAELKTGGAFPFLAASADIALHLIVHLRACSALPSPTPGGTPLPPVALPTPTSTTTSAAPPAAAPAAPTSPSPSGGAGSEGVELTSLTLSPPPSAA